VGSGSRSRSGRRRARRSDDRGVMMQFDLACSGSAQRTDGCFWPFSALYFALLVRCRGQSRRSVVALVSSITPWLARPSSTFSRSTRLLAPRIGGPTRTTFSISRRDAAKRTTRPSLGGRRFRRQRHRYPPHARAGRHDHRSHHIGAQARAAFSPQFEGSRLRPGAACIAARSRSRRARCRPESTAS
jgi:hypothetical protein